jgi:hypothetical protein
MPATPKGLTDEKATRIILGLRAGKMLRSFSVRALRFNAYCVAHPEYGREAQALLAENLKSLNKRKAARFRAMTHCKYGHSLADASLYQKDGYVARHCRTCRIIRAKRPGIIKPESGEKVRALLKANAPISSFTKAGRGSYVMSHVTFTQFRREDPEIELLASRVIAGAQHHAQKRRWVRVRNQSKREQNNDYYKILALLPANFPDRDDVVSNIFEALLSGSLRREDVRTRIRQFINAHDRSFSSKYAKFGPHRLFSLDAPLFEDGNSTWGDTATHTLWD